jgi:hypothetical protein
MRSAGRAGAQCLAGTARRRPFRPEPGALGAGGSYEHDTTYENTTFDIRDANAGNVFDALGLPPINKVPTILSTTYDSKGVRECGL